MRLPNLLEDVFRTKLLDVQRQVLEAPGDFDMTIIDEKESELSREGYEFKQKVNNASIINLKASGWMHQHASVEDVLRYFCLCHFAEAYFVKGKSVKTASGYSLATNPVQRFGTALVPFRCYPMGKTVETGLVRYLANAPMLSIELDEATNDKFIDKASTSFPTPDQLFADIVKQVEFAQRQRDI